MSNLQYAEYKIKNAYLQKYRALKNTPYYNGGKQLDAAVAKAAVYCIEMNADPELYVEAVYWKYKDVGFYPNQLIAANIDKIYHEFIESIKVVGKVEIEKQFCIQKHYLLTAIKNTTREPEVILMDDALNFSPWFRVCITKEPVPALLAKYGKEAKKLMTPEIADFLAANNLDTKRLENL